MAFIPSFFTWHHAENLLMLQFTLKALRQNYHRTTSLLIAWMLVTISLPILKWSWGSEILPVGLTLGVTFQAAAIFSILLDNWGWKRALVTVALISCLTLLIEVIDSSTGFPFGVYRYIGSIQPQVQHVPILVPLAWFMMLPCAWAIAASFMARHWLFVVFCATAMTAWDLLLDPHMVAWNIWRWDFPGGYFGIPWSNYIGWLLTATFITIIVRPIHLPILPLLLIYTMTWFLETLGLLFFWDLPGPALVGGLVMGIFVGLGWHQSLKDWRPFNKIYLEERSIL